MDEFLRWLASWKGITVEPGSELQFELAAFPTGGLGMLVLLGCLGVVVAVGFFYRRDGKNLTVAQRIVLGSLRALAVLAAVLVLLEPNLVTVKRETRPGHTILLVDNSQSMMQTDPYRRDGVQDLATGWRALGVEDPANKSRFDLIRALLAHDDGVLVRKLGSKNLPQLYSFAGNIDQLPLLPPPEGPAGSAAAPDAPPPLPRLDLQKFVADGRATNLGGSLRAALDRSRNVEIAAVVIVSDGRRNTGPQSAEVARLLEQRKIPHTFVLGVGDPSATQVVELSRIEAPEKVFQKDPFEIRSNVVAQGYDAMSLTVRLVRIDEAGSETEVRRQQVEIGGDKAEAVVPWQDLSVETPGKYRFRAEIAPPDGEPPAPERHSKIAQVEVLGERARVLLLSSASTFEYQMLRNLLTRDKTIDVSCWVQNADEKFPQDGDEEVRIDRLPESRQQLDPYDVVILVDPNQGLLTGSFCEALQQHVLENGCGLVWCAGEKFTTEALRPTATTKPLADLLPVIPDVEYAERKMSFGIAFKWPVRFELAPEGADGIGGKLSRLVDGKDERRLLWSRLDGFHFWYPVKGTKPAATAVAESTNPDPQFRRDNHGMPMIATQNAGAGRVLWIGTDETYRWRSRYEDAYNRFWVNAIRYLFEGRIHAGNSRLRLLLDAEKLDLGEPIRITAEVRDEALQPFIADTFEVVVEREGQAAENLQLVPIEGLPGSYELQFRPTQVGTYRVRPAQKIGKSVELAFQVVAAQIEREGPMDRAELKAVVGKDENGNRYFDTPAQLLAALDEIPSRSATDTFRTPHAIWDGWATVVFVLTLLAIEWILRKRFNLL
ncbi:MAG: hypothetical protein U1E73_02195 [Planctomycetota bacterium]